MKKYTWVVLFLNLMLLLAYFNYSIFEKEEIVSNGKLILLKLAPVDPRSLMQGDYMALRYSIPETISLENIPKRGFCVVEMQSPGTATIVRLQEDKIPLRKNEHLIKYTKNTGVNIGAESFFFQEGHAKKYENASFGGIKIDEDGNSVLIGLYDENLKQIK